MNNERKQTYNRREFLEMMGFSLLAMTRAKENIPQAEAIDMTQEALLYHIHTLYGYAKAGAIGSTLFDYHYQSVFNYALSQLNDDVKKAHDATQTRILQWTYAKAQGIDEPTFRSVYEKMIAFTQYGKDLYQIDDPLNSPLPAPGTENMTKPANHDEVQNVLSWRLLNRYYSKFGIVTPSDFQTEVNRHSVGIQHGTDAFSIPWRLQVVQNNKQITTDMLRHSDLFSPIDPRNLQKGS